MNEFLNKVREKAKKKILYLPHAMAQMNQPDRMITPEEIREVLFKGEIIEDYADDPRGHSCLMGGKTKNGNRHIHIVCSPKDEYLAIITAYIPSFEKWMPNFKKRRK